MTRDTYDITVRRASQLSHRLDLFKSSQNCRRASQITRRSFLQENEFRGSERTLFGSTLDSASDSVNSSRTNVQTSASCSYSNSRNDINYDDDDDGDDGDDDEEEDEDVDEDTARCSSKAQEESEGDRGVWEKNWHYIFLGFGVVFSIRNVTAFPSLILQHGGGAFFFTYVVLTYTVGIPLIYLEVSLGQYARGGLVKAWGIMPLAKGICISSLILGIVSAAFTTTTPSAWALYYFYRAFIGYGSSKNSKAIHDLWNSSRSVFNLSSNHSTRVLFTNQTALQAVDDSTSFFYHSTLQVSSSISYFGDIVSHLVVPLVILWGFVFIYASFGPRIMGKLSIMFSAVASVLLLIATIGVCTLSGSVLGIQTLLNPHWHYLNQVNTWLDSLELVLTSLCSGTGVMITLSGHCNFHGNTFKHAILMTSMSVVMTITSGCLMMATLGVQSKQSGIPISNISQNSDVDFGFVVYPAVTSYLNASGFWSGILYLALVLLGIVKASVMVHNLHQGFLDLVRAEDISIPWRLGTLGALVLLLTCINITSVAQNGLYILRLLQQSIPRLATPVICVAQCVVIAWGYGARRFAGRVSEMTGKNKSFVWKWLWRWGCPVLLSLSVLVVLMKRDSVKYLPVADCVKPELREIFWLLPLAIVIPGLVVCVVSFIRIPGTFKQRIKRLCATPVPWGPGHPEHEPQADLPDYVICHPDPFRPANALAMLTANLYLPNIVNFVNGDKKPEKGADMSPGYLSELGTMSSSDEEGSVDLPPSKESVFGRCWATLGCLNHVIGLGNVVRFPYLVYKHGGGAFLIAYLSLLLTCGLPLVVIEIAIGQFSSFGPINVWRAVPLFKGLGFCMVGISLVTSVYYAVVASWAIYYLATTLTSVMPWQFCDNAWNTNSCVIITHQINDCYNNNKSLNSTNHTTAPTATESLCDVAIDGCLRLDTTLTSCNYVTKNGTTNRAFSSSTAEYFYKAVTDVSGGLEEPGSLRWQLVLCLLLFWVVVGLCMVKRSRSGGKMTYLVVILPVSLFLILLIRCSGLPGAKQGLRYLFTPDLWRLTAGHVWRDAASQVFFSLALGSGAFISSSTYNKFNSHIFRESGLVCFIDTCMSLLASLLMFSVVGALSYQTGLPLQKTVNADPGLSFVLLSHAVLQLPWSLFWAVLVFLSLVLCGIATCSSAVASAVLAISERTSLRKQRVWLVLVLVSAAFLAGIMFTVQGGFYMIELFDLHLSGLPQLVVGGFMLAAFAWVYGSSRLASDIARMTKAPVRWWWRPLWVAISPGFVAACIVVSLTSLLTYRDNPHIPWWGTALGILLWFFLDSPIIYGLFHELIVSKSGSFLVRLRRSCRSRKDWGATASRYHSHVEYFPTVHTNIGIDLNVGGLNTIADHVEFTTVGVRMPSLSQTTLLPVSPKSPRHKRPMDMRHKAILNHAYSNPQCNMSSGSLEKIGKKKKRGSGLSLNASQESMTNSIIMKRSKKKGLVCNASTQTEKYSVGNSRLLQRQRSQPFVWVSKPVRVMARSLSWHSMRGEPAILEVSDQRNSCEDVRRNTTTHDSLQLDLSKIKTAKGSSLSCLKEEEQHQQEQDLQTRRRRRVGQSVAPNLGTLMNSLQQSNPHTPLLKGANNATKRSVKKRRGKSKAPQRSSNPINDQQLLRTKTKSLEGNTPETKQTSDFKEMATVEILKHSQNEENISNKWEDEEKVMENATSSEYFIDDSWSHNKESGSKISVRTRSSSLHQVESETDENNVERRVNQALPQIPTLNISSTTDETPGMFFTAQNNYCDQMNIAVGGKSHSRSCAMSRDSLDAGNCKEKEQRINVKYPAVDESEAVVGKNRTLKEICMASGSIIMEEEEGMEEEVHTDVTY